MINSRSNQWFGLAVGVGLTLAVAGGAAEPTASRTLVIESLLKSPSTLGKLRASGVDGIQAIEDLLTERSQLKTESVAQLVPGLGHAEYRMRQQATEKLALFPVAILPVLEREAQSATDPEVKARLRDVMAAIQTVEQRVPALLAVLHELYAAHADDVFRRAWPVLLKNPRQPSALYAIDQIPFERAWENLKSASQDEKLTYLLLKVYTGETELARTKLHEFLAKDLLRVAAATWWPIEIEPIEKDGTYGWTTRAEAIEGNMARNVIRLSVTMPDNGYIKSYPSITPGLWEHLEQWSQITYIFRFPSYCSKNVVAFSRPVVRLDDAVRWKLVPSKPVSGFQGRCNTFRGVPSTASLPLARISGQESLDWHLGAAYEWAKPLIPEDVAKLVTFIANKYPAPQITTGNK